jgi:hypothetical protein
MSSYRSWSAKHSALLVTLLLAASAAACKRPVDLASDVLGDRRDPRAPMPCGGPWDGPTRIERQDDQLARGRNSEAYRAMVEAEKKENVETRKALVAETAQNAAALKAAEAKLKQRPSDEEAQAAVSALRDEAEGLKERLADLDAAEAVDPFDPGPSSAAVWVYLSCADGNRLRADYPRWNHGVNASEKFHVSCEPGQICFFHFPKGAPVDEDVGSFTTSYGAAGRFLEDENGVKIKGPDGKYVWTDDVMVKPFDFEAKTQDGRSVGFRLQSTDASGRVTAWAGQKPALADLTAAQQTPPAPARGETTEIRENYTTHIAPPGTTAEEKRLLPTFKGTLVLFGPTDTQFLKSLYVQGGEAAVSTGADSARAHLSYIRPGAVPTRPAGTVALFLDERMAVPSANGALAYELGDASRSFLFNFGPDRRALSFTSGASPRVSIECTGGGSSRTAKCRVEIRK